MADQKMERMKELVTRLRAASRAYYQESRELMSNYEYDSLYDELTALEKETGTVLAGSPTVNVGYEVVSELPKERHEQPMLSLDKTKRCGRAGGFCRRTQKPAVLEAGWPDHRAYLPGWSSFLRPLPGETGKWERSSRAMPGYFVTSRCISPMRAS